MSNVGPLRLRAVPSATPRMRCTILALVVVLLATPQLTHAKGGGGGGGGGGRSAASGAGFSAASSGGRGSTYSFRRRASVGHRQNYGYGRGGSPKTVGGRWLEAAGAHCGSAFSCRCSSPLC